MQVLYTSIKFSLLISTASLVSISCAQAEEFLVEDQKTYFEIVKKAGPGDVIKLANGQWDDFEIVFQGNGEKDNPIRLTAETKGQVILTGQSNLRLSGEYLEVSGLVFKDGYTPTQDVISFRMNKEELANNSRVTETVIDNFSNPERQETDFWVMMYGKNNRFDHNALIGKSNRGVTMAVRLDSDASRENNHRIDHNYFGPRSILGSNGGETLRIGTSHHSLTDSLTLVENNYFDRCDGELEIISVKSGKNTLRNNTFYKSRGTLTMRHGNQNQIEGNVFFGEGEDHTGGIRVINAGHTIRHNYMEGLKGTRFGGAFVVMNGVPNSPINRYHQVKDAVIENNSIINSDNIQLGAGSDPERSAVPEDTRFANNLIVHADGRDTFTVYDDMSGIEFENNVLDGPLPKDLPKDGFEQSKVAMVRADNGLLYPKADIDAGAKRELSVTTKDMVGPDWYPKTDPLIPFGSGNVITIKPGDKILSETIKDANAGDTIILSSGDYVVSKFLKLDKPLTFKGKGTVNLTFERSTMFEILDGGNLQLINLNISGDDSPDYSGNSVIRTSPYSMLQNYRIEIIDTNMRDLDTNHSFNVISAAKNTFADHILIKNSNFKNVSGSIARLDRENDENGVLSAEYVTIEDSKFENIGQTLVAMLRGGRDESTFGPHFKMTDSKLSNVGFDKRNKTESSLYLHGVQVTDVKDNVFEKSRPFLINHTVGEPKTKITENRFKETDGPIVNELNSEFENTAIIENNIGLEK